MHFYADAESFMRGQTLPYLADLEARAGLRGTPIEKPKDLSTFIHVQRRLEFDFSGLLPVAAR